MELNQKSTHKLAVLKSDANVAMGVSHAVVICALNKHLIVLKISVWYSKIDFIFRFARNIWRMDHWFSQLRFCSANNCSPFSPFCCEWHSLVFQPEKCKNVLVEFHLLCFVWVFRWFWLICLDCLVFLGCFVIFGCFCYFDFLSHLLRRI